MADGLDTETVLAGLRAAGEATRLRVIALLAYGELNVTDLTQILGQSQPRISRHLKLLTEAGLVERHREGSWVFFRLGQGGAADLAAAIVDNLDPDDAVLARDRARAEAVKLARAEAAQDYFRAHAAEWDRIRAHHVAEDQVEDAVLSALGPGPFDLLVDLGTGTGRMLELMADRIGQGIGIDINPDMLAYARAKLDTANLAQCQVRQGDLYNLDMEDGEADAVVIHQVLHFLPDPLTALKEAGRVLAPGGKLVVVDFAAHQLEFLREEFAHERLGFDAAQMAKWIKDSGLGSCEHRSMKPGRGAGADKLTVSIWTATKPGKRSAARAQEARAELMV